MPWGQYLQNNLQRRKEERRKEESTRELIGGVTLLIKIALADGAWAICDSSHFILFY